MKPPWPTKKLGEVCELVRGSEPGSESYFDKMNEERIRFIRVGDISGKVDQPKFVYKNLANLIIVNPDEILISFDGTPGIVTKGWSGAIASGIRVIRNIKPEILKEFLFYYLQTSEPQKVIKFYTTGVTILHASRAIPHIKIPLPPLKVQQKIVERLGAIKKAQELNDKQIELAEELFKSLLHCELDPKGKNWEVKKLIEVCEINPKTVLNKKIDKVRYVEMTAIDENLKTIKYYLDRSINKVSSGAPKFTNNDIIFARITPCTENGKIALVDNCKDICAGSTELHVLRPKKDKILPHFLFYFIITPKIRNIAVASMIGSTGRQRVPAEFFHYLKIPLPPLETQQKIVEKLSAVQEYKKKLLDQKQKLQELFESVLNKSFKGELVG